MTKAEDNEYEEYKIEQVEPVREGPKMWLATLEYGYTVTLPRGGGAKQPKEGMTIRIYGDIEDGNIRGIDLDQTQVFYRTPEEQKEWLVEQEKEAARAARAEYEIRKHEFAQRLERLPKAVQARIERLREQAEDADDFNALYLEAELVVSEHAWWLSKLIHSKIDLGIFRSIPSVSKMGSVYAQMCDDLRAELKEAIEKGPKEEQSPAEHQKHVEDLRARCDIVEGTTFIVDLSPEWLDKMFEIAATLIGDDEDELPPGPEPRAIRSPEDMLK